MWFDNFFFLLENHNSDTIQIQHTGSLWCLQNIVGKVNEVRFYKGCDMMSYIEDITTWQNLKASLEIHLSEIPGKPQRSAIKKKMQHFTSRQTLQTDMTLIHKFSKRKYTQGLRTKLTLDMVWHGHRNANSEAGTFKKNTRLDRQGLIIKV